MFHLQGKLALLETLVDLKKSANDVAKQSSLGSGDQPSSHF
jgi:hypothetical protein